ncbi:hypothetical protein CDAR_189861 [Caerostris darwini]|uniref:Uncharacterized protein n=1 Tax=Caerostris darwini TaxID=1538125 RepID=A0AAV4V2D8_9ARAC|nr:hypothetical protein CDAR_189861 [Caerostris darwini]
MGWEGRRSLTLHARGCSCACARGGVGDFSRGHCCDCWRVPGRGDTLRRTREGTFSHCTLSENVPSTPLHTLLIEPLLSFLSPIPMIS